MKQMRSLSMLAAVLCLGLSCIATAAVGDPPPVPAAVQAVASTTSVAYAKPALVAATSAQAIVAAEHATASASERGRTGTLPGQALTSQTSATSATAGSGRASPLTAEVGHAKRARTVAGGKGGCKPPRKLIT